MEAISSPLAPSRAMNHAALAGWTLLIVTLLAVLVMAHHPSASLSDTAQAILRIDELSRPAELVHAAMMTLLLVTFYGLLEFVMQRGWSRPLMRAGTIAYLVGLVVMMGAALVSGFVLPDVAAMMPHDTTVDLQIDRQLLILCRILNQACANFGVVAMSIGIGLWSLDLLRDRGLLRATGVLGVVVCLVPIVGLTTGLIRLDVHGALRVLAIQAVWNLTIAVWLIREGHHASAAPEMR